MSSWGSKSISTFVRRRRYTRMEHRPAVTSAKVDRVAAALAERDRLIGPYSKPADKLVLRVTSSVFETDAHQQRHFELRLSWYVCINLCAANDPRVRNMLVLYIQETCIRCVSGSWHMVIVMSLFVTRLVDECFVASLLNISPGTVYSTMPVCVSCARRRWH